MITPTFPALLLWLLMMATVAVAIDGSMEDEPSPRLTPVVWYCDEDSNTTLSCSASGDCLWIADLDNGGSLNLQMENVRQGLYEGYSSWTGGPGGDCSLHLTDVSSSQAGLWMCQQSGSSIAYYDLSVNFATKPMMFHRGIQFEDQTRLDVQEGDLQQFQCIVDSSSPPVNIRWIVNGTSDVSDNAYTATYVKGVKNVTHSSSAAPLFFRVEGSTSLSCSVFHKTLDEPSNVTLILNVQNSSGVTDPSVATDSSVVTDSSVATDFSVVTDSTVVTDSSAVAAKLSKVSVVLTILLVLRSSVGTGIYATH